MKKVLITGGKGRIGSEIVTQLGEKYNFVVYDYPEYDARDFDTLKTLAAGIDCIIHLAWDTSTDNYTSNQLSLDNTKMALNVYRVAQEVGIPRVIMASSVHAGRIGSTTEIFDSLTTVTSAETIYGAHKQCIESLGRHYAQHGLEVLCLRFGGTCYSDAPDPNPKETHLWLSRPDLISLIDQSIEHEHLDERFVLIPAISHTTATTKQFPENALGWRPGSNTSTVQSE